MVLRAAAVGLLLAGAASIAIAQESSAAATAEGAAQASSAASGADNSAERAVTHLLDNIDFPSSVAADIDGLKTTWRSREGESDLVRSLDEPASVISAQLANRRRRTARAETRAPQ